MIDYEKTTGALSTPPAATENTFEQILALTVAKMQIAGFGVHRIEGGWLVCKWGLSRLCTDLAELRAFGKKTGAL